VQVLAGDAFDEVSPARTDNLSLALVDIADDFETLHSKFALEHFGCCQVQDNCSQGEQMLCIKPLIEGKQSNFVEFQ
jgi:hypothetical protein